MSFRNLILLVALGALLLPRDAHAASTITLRLPEGGCPTSYDVVIHLHGRDPLVLEGLEAAGIDAAVVVVNLGVTSTVYQQAFASTTHLDRLLLRVEQRWESRGCETRRDRLALSVWSAGYGGALRLLQQVPQRFDAFVGMDAPYASYMGQSGHIAPPSLRPFLAYARRAAQGEVLMAISHSQIRTPGYASAKEVTSAILRALGVSRRRDPAHIEVRDSSAVSMAFGGASPTLKRRSVAEARDLWVGSFGGTDAQAHVAHLTHAPQTVWAKLAHAWAADAIMIDRH